jgi:hypothetical protein
MNVELDAETEAQARSSHPPLPAFSWVALLVRMLARAWVVLLLLGAAAFGGVAVTQVLQKQAELEELRREPGPSAYAVLAYRAELERQIQALNADRTVDAVPSPPSRPALLEEIDLARARNATVSQATRSESLGGISAPP